MKIFRRFLCSLTLQLKVEIKWLEGVFANLIQIKDSCTNIIKN